MIIAGTILFGEAAPVSAQALKSKEIQAMFTESTKPWLDNYEEGVPGVIDVPDYPLQYLLENSAV